MQIDHETTFGQFKKPENPLNLIERGDLNSSYSQAIKSRQSIRSNNQTLPAISVNPVS